MFQAKIIVKMMSHSKVHPVEEVLSMKSLELGPCIVITPRTLDLGQQILDKQLEDPDVMSMYSEDNRELQQITEDQEECHENIKIQSPVHSEHKVNMNYSYTLHSPGEAPRDIAEYPKVAEKATQPSQHKLLSFSSAVKPVVLPSPAEDDWRRKSIVSKDFSSGSRNEEYTLCANKRFMEMVIHDHIYVFLSL